MTKEEATKKLADIIFNATKSGYMPYDTNDEMCAMNIAKKHIDEFYTSLPSNLDEAAVQAHIRMEESGEEMTFLNTFKAGAEWMAGQGAKFDTEMSWLDSFGFQIGWPEDTSIFDCFDEGDKVVVQIRKK